VNPLTPRQAQILARLATGMTMREIAAELGISVSTVKNHLAVIYRTLGVHNSAGAFTKMGWIKTEADAPPPDPRTAALLKAAWNEGFEDVMTYADAAAILAALPADWCGHNMAEWVPRAEWREDWNRRHAAEAEIACLRRIEEAAREVMDDCEVEARGEGCGPHDALRAALEENP
jgi:DNA-binding CsgD family transcriptional regulator